MMQDTPYELAKNNAIISKKDKTQEVYAAQHGKDNVVDAQAKADAEQDIQDKKDKYCQENTKPHFFASNFHDNNIKTE